MNRFSYKTISILVFFAALFMHKTACAQDDEGWSCANATVRNEVSVYLYKPEYTGLFGMGSLFTNKLEVVLADYNLPKGARIRLIEKWDTGLRGYRIDM